ncbi:MAG: hypothetical protein M0Z44_07455 [Gammaproteobacteria bacterium]|nr:hypothetical protein [Gammaproteobacteria bacterium]
MVSHTPVQEVRRLAYAPVHASSPWARLLRFLPKPARTPAAQAPPPARRRRGRAFAYYPHAGRLLVVRAGSHGLGIAAGTWIAARLARAITSADTALIVLHTVAPVAGARGALAAGARLLAQAQQVAGDRLLLRVRTVVTPRGRTLAANGVVFSHAYRMGLAGFVRGKRRSRAWFALGQSLVQSADQALSLVGGGGSTPVAALGRAGRSVLSTSIRWHRARLILYVPPQSVEVQLEGSL